MMMMSATMMMGGCFRVFEFLPWFIATLFADQSTTLASDSFLCVCFRCVSYALGKRSGLRPLATHCIDGDHLGLDRFQGELDLAERDPAHAAQCNCRILSLLPAAVIKDSGVPRRERSVATLVVRRCHDRRRDWTSHPLASPRKYREYSVKRWLRKTGGIEG